jgi:acyl CoA:acetate/3-ketoacid CoA transferase
VLPVFYSDFPARFSRIRMRKSMAAQYFSTLCRLLHPQFDDVGDSGDELTVGGLALVRMNRVAEVAVQHFQISSAPGNFHQMAQGPPEIAFIGTFVA